MNKSTCYLLAALAFTSLGSFAEEAEDPAMAVVKRMRDSLRTTMILQQKTEAERAALQAEKIDLEAKNAELTKKLADLLKEHAKERTASEKTITDLNEKSSEQAAQIAQLDESLAKWKIGYQKMEDVAKAKEAERSKLADKLILQDRRVADYRRMNEELYKTGTEVLNRYEAFGLGTALTAREPFTRLTRVKMEGLVQEFKDKLTDQKIKPSDLKQTPAAQASAAAVQAPRATPEPVKAAQ
jgi:chromosome segregation ATPase